MTKKSQEAAMAEALVDSGLIPRLREYAKYVPTMDDKVSPEDLAAGWSGAVLAALRGWHLERGRAEPYLKFLETIFTPRSATTLTCAKCESTDLVLRWDAEYHDCLRKEQDRSDWPRDGGEHMHYICRVCGWSWAVAVGDNWDPRKSGI